MSTSTPERELIAGMARDFLTEITRCSGGRRMSRQMRAWIIEDAVFAAGGCLAKMRGREPELRERAAITRTHLRMTDRFLYAIQAGDDGPVKIGQTLNPAARLATLQQASWLELHGLAAWRATPYDEKCFHAEFAHVRIRGEWFEPSTELVETVLWHGGEFSDWRPLTVGEQEALALWASE